ncbi:hypothetical protein ACSYDW_01215 [Paeniglutamicibacter sp. R2-26]|uniref:hypothetical protein n=1 Tax=Paeniglutamicibacter sp. R2-26 TaxID=3144417 RepID=UPI003EE6F54E
MSQRKYGEVLITIRGERSKPVRLDVSWTSRADLHSQVKAKVAAWAKHIWKRQNAQVDITTLDTDGGGKILINGETEAVARFRVELQSLSVPEPVAAFDIVGAR